MLRLLFHQGAMQSTFKEGTPEWIRHKRSYDQTLAQLRALVPQASSDPDGKVPNPEFLVLAGKIAADEEAHALLVAEINSLEGELSTERQRIEALKEGYRLYNTKLRELKEAETNRDLALEELHAAELILGQLSIDVPVEVVRPAQVPPRPTEPNVLVVALIGCILGLGAAIGLILLLDFLQGTYKTVDDVERGLSVPVLGAVSHLETDEEREHAVRHRRRVSTVAAAALVLITIVVTIFYLDPTRLPPVVRDLLALVLG